MANNKKRATKKVRQEPKFEGRPPVGATAPIVPSSSVDALLEHCPAEGTGSAPYAQPLPGRVLPHPHLPIPGSFGSSQTCVATDPRPELQLATQANPGAGEPATGQLSRAPSTLTLHTLIQAACPTVNNAPIPPSHAQVPAPPFATLSRDSPTDILKGAPYGSSDLALQPEYAPAPVVSAPEFLQPPGTLPSTTLSYRPPGFATLTAFGPAYAHAPLCPSDGVIHRPSVTRENSCSVPGATTESLVLSQSAAYGDTPAAQLTDSSEAALMAEFLEDDIEDADQQLSTGLATDEPRSWFASTPQFALFRQDVLELALPLDFLEHLIALTCHGRSVAETQHLCDFCLMETFAHIRAGGVFTPGILDRTTYIACEDHRTCPGDVYEAGESEVFCFHFLLDAEVGAVVMDIKDVTLGPRSAKPAPRPFLSWPRYISDDRDVSDDTVTGSDVSEENVTGPVTEAEAQLAVPDSEASTDLPSDIPASMSAPTTPQGHPPSQTFRPQAIPNDWVLTEKEVPPDTRDTVAPTTCPRFEQHTCKTCDPTTTHPAAEELHVKNKPPFCKLCKRAFSTQVEAAKHCSEAPHALTKKYIRHFKLVPPEVVKAALERTHRTCDKENPRYVYCRFPDCEEKNGDLAILSEDSQTLKKHYLSFHFENARVLCSICGEDFSGSTTLRNHTKKLHTPKAAAKNMTPQDDATAHNGKRTLDAEEVKSPRKHRKVEA